MSRSTRSPSLRAAVMAAVWLALISVAQGATGSERFEPLPLPPEAWGRPDPMQVQNGCPKVTGSYKVVPDVYEAKGENRRLEAAVGERVDFIRLFVHPRRVSSGKSISQVQVLPQPVPPEKLAITLEQKSSDEFSLVSYSFDGRREFRAVFDRAQQDFICKDGYIEISFKPVEEHADGRTYRIDSYRRFTRTTDGALLFYEQHRTWSREALVFTRSETRHRYYRFLPTEPPR